MKITFFSFAIFAFASAVFASPAPSNVKTIALAYVSKINGKGGQLDTDLREQCFNGIKGLNKTEKANLWTEIKLDVGSLIGKVNNAEIKALPGLISPFCKGSLKQSAALDAVLKNVTPAIIKDLQSRVDALATNLLKSIPSEVATLTSNKANAAIVAANIKSIVADWNKQLLTLAKHFNSTSFPKNLAAQLN